MMKMSHTPFLTWKLCLKDFACLVVLSGFYHLAIHSLNIKYYIREEFSVFLSGNSCLSSFLKVLTFSELWGQVINFRTHTEVGKRVVQGNTHKMYTQNENSLSKLCSRKEPWDEKNDKSWRESKWQERKEKKVYFIFLQLPILIYSKSLECKTDLVSIFPSCFWGTKTIRINSEHEQMERGERREKIPEDQGTLLCQREIKRERD